MKGDFIAKKCNNNIGAYGQISRCKIDNCLCCIYPQEKCPQFVERKFPKFKV